jgi:cytochrome c oxidase assembly factor CtaG
VLTMWAFAFVPSPALAGLAAAYLAGVWRVRRRHPARPWPAARALAFLAGLAVTAAATQSAVAAYDGVLFSAHMVQHVLLIMVVPPLLVAGRPIILLMHACRNPVHTWVKRAVRSRAVTALTWPPATTLLYGLVVAGTHTPPVMDLVVRHALAHDAEHALYLVSGYLFFLPIVGSEPIRWRLSLPGRYLMLLAGMQVDTVAGVVLMVSGHPLFPAYTAARRPWGFTALADVHAGGTIMWMGSDITMAFLAITLASVFFYGSRQAGAASDEASLAAYNARLAALGRRSLAR